MSKLFGYEFDSKKIREYLDSILKDYGINQKIENKYYKALIDELEFLVKKQDRKRKK